MLERSSLWGGLLFLYAALVFALALNILPWQVDDAYITYRYVENFLGHGLFSFNPEGAPVEGMTGTLWFWLLVAAGVIGGVKNLPLIASAMGLFILLATVFILWRRVSPVFGRWPAFVALMTLLSVPAVPFYAVTGMDQLLFSVLVLFIALHLSGYLQGHKEACVLIVLAVWARPEAPVIGAMILLRAVWPGPQRGLANQIPYVAALLAGMASLLLYRYIVFADVLPNTYYAKPSSFMAGMDYLRSSLWHVEWFAFLVVFGLSSSLVGDSRHRLLCTYALLWLLVPVAEGGDWMPLLRFFLPAILLLSMAVAGWFSFRHRLPLFLLVLALLFVPWKGIGVIDRFHQYGDISFTSKKYMFLYLQHWLDSNRLSRIATMDIGQLAFGKPYDVTDLGGLTDRVIAHLPGRHMEKQVAVDYLLARQVEVVMLRVDANRLLRGFGQEALYSVTEKQLYADADFRQSFRLVMVIGEPDGRIDAPDQYLVYVRADLVPGPAPLPVIQRQGYALVVYPGWQQ